MSRLNRRRFLRTATAASAAFSTFAIAGTKASGRIIGANDTIRMGVAGINGRGRRHLQGFAAQDKVDVTYLIDPDSHLFDSRSEIVRKHGGNEPKSVQDVRRALDDPNLDAIAIATTNHWHSLMSIWACQAGKHVYVEKPLSHNVFEGRKLVEAARKYNRVVQHGTQQRSEKNRAGQMAAIRAEKYGKLLVSKGYCCKQRWSIGYEPIGDPPTGLDFNLWLGPAQEQPYHGNLVHYDWHWFWDTGCGDIGNQGVHEMDIAHWAIKDATLPTSVWSLGGRFTPDAPTGTDQGQTPNMQIAVYDFGETLLVFETRGLVGRDGLKARVCNEFYTTEGMITTEGHGGGAMFHPRGDGSPEPVVGEPVEVTPGGAFGSFIVAVRSGNPQDINCDAEVGHRSSAVCHLGNISYRLGESVPFNKRTKSLGDNKQVVEAFDNVKENLKAVGVSLDENSYQLGRTLNFDPVSERFVGDQQANALLTRDYRAPFVVPDRV